VGGTGKTPLSIKIAEMINNIGRKPVIIKKYYSQLADEIDLIKDKGVNLIQDKNRVDAIKESENKKYDVAILDDGFQDASIKKNLNILCFNEKQLIGNGLIIPAGPLRQSLNYIKDSQIILINGNHNKSFEKKINKISSKIKIFYSSYLPLNIIKFKNRKLLAFAGIGNPENFFNLLRENDLEVKKTISFPDHYKYNKNEMNKLLKTAKESQLELVTTEKDHFRLKKMGYTDISHIDVKLKIEKEEELIEELKKYL
tara:strand:- start:97 stop:864 length:768 start_codon:yes stop_codon:yes gene_type:complete